MRKLLLITIAILGALGQSSILALYMITGLCKDRARRAADNLPLTTILHTEEIERKILLLEWLLSGLACATFGPALILKMFGAKEDVERFEDGTFADCLYLHLDKRYDMNTKKSFCIEVILYLDTYELTYATICIPDAMPKEIKPVGFASWPDATSALMSYYGSGEAEEAGVGYQKGTQDTTTEDDCT